MQDELGPLGLGWASGGLALNISTLQQRGAPVSYIVFASKSHDSLPKGYLFFQKVESNAVNTIISERSFTNIRVH
jgi:hypothetical protein